MCSTYITARYVGRMKKAESMDNQPSTSCMNVDGDFVENTINQNESTIKSITIDPNGKQILIFSPATMFLETFYRAVELLDQWLKSDSPNVYDDRECEGSQAK